MKTLGAYLPTDRRQALRDGRDLPELVAGALLFADISGFTPLTESFAQQLGPQRGAEELTNQLNRVYGALIAQVDAYGGSVIGFSGDAITCLFAGDNGHRALTCALQMQMAMGQFATMDTPNGSTVALTIHVAVAVGPARRFVVGDPRIQQIDVLAGHTLDILSVAASHAGRGEVVADAEVAAQLSQAVVGSWRFDQPSGRRLAVIAGLCDPAQPAPVADAGGSVPPERLRPWLLPAVYQRLLHSSDHFLAELRPAAALFLSFSGIDYDNDPQAGRQLDRYICHVQRVLERFAGTLLQVTIGEKGSYLYAAFGAPVAHTDTATRALATALELRHTDGLAPISAVRIGLAYGLMYTGAYGGPSRRTYGVLGDKTNLAARLMVLAEPGTINCDDEIYRHAHRRWEFEALPPARVKGKVGKVRIYRPTDRPAAQGGGSGLAGGRLTLMGRSSERARLAWALDTLQAGVGKVLFIEGEAGIGKSRLVDELALLMRERGLAGLLGAGQSIDQQTPYRAWRDIFSSFFALDQVVDLAERRERVRQLIHEAVPEQLPRLPLLNDVLNLSLPDTPLTATLDPALRQESLAGLLIALLQVWANERPLVLVLEDSHWLDSLSWSLAVRLGRTMLQSDAPILLVLVQRPLDGQTPGTPHAAALRALACTETLVLSQLQPPEIVALATARLGLPDAGLPEQVAQLVIRRSGGNPFFAEEVIYGLRDRGVIVVEPAAGQPPTMVCRLAGDIGAAAQALPDTLHGLILARIDRLSSDQQLAIKVAAVIGQTFSHAPLLHMLCQCAAMEPHALPSNLAELERQEFIRQEALEPGPSYGFRHVIVQEVAYQTLLFAQRRRLHRSLIDWYEASGGGQPGWLAPYYPLLAHHARYAEDRDCERRYAWLAGQQAAARYANTEAVAYFSRALEVTPAAALGERYDLHFARARACDLLGARALQHQDLQALAELAAAMDDTRRRAETALWQSRYYEAVGHYLAATAAAEQSTAWARAAGAVDIEAAAARSWGLVLWLRGEAQARERLEHALRLAGGAGLKNIEANSLESLGNLSWSQSNYLAARTYYQQALLRYREIGERRGESTTLNNLGIVSEILRDPAEAERYYTQALRIARELNDRRSESKVLTSLGCLADSQGAYEDAAACYEQSLSIYRDVADRSGESEVLHYLALLACHRNDYPLAHRYGQQALWIAQEIGSHDQQARALIAIGNGLLALGQLQGAGDAYQRALNLWCQQDQYDLATEPCAGLADVALARQEQRHALHYAEQILDHLAHGALDNTIEPFRIYLTCYQALVANDDQRADAILSTAHQQLQERAAAIGDPQRRQLFLERVATHRQLVQAFELGRATAAAAGSAAQAAGSAPARCRQGP